MDLKKILNETPNITKLDLSNQNLSENDSTLRYLENFKNLQEVKILMIANFR